ncbi:peptidyl-glycine alpha-amidating monooxygenase B-like [Saccoglossus kowalevskii]|uniref:Peptidyl-glycine alpha-amidating monooxygenase-like n=1 Tax=Saccoglossus kowalevskii TaxID=10224 RepID=A0A0U2UAN0_SACKO|nr:PREDICTED: peptidyl-glycine alpha-amidating monooxygenase-like [Saccoglossus kowalevskii]ALR88639.1 peptidylglycine alpha-amidating monooxygenase-like 320 [Saccoglossus kowalevskii]
MAAAPRLTIAVLLATILYVQSYTLRDLGSQEDNWAKDEAEPFLEDTGILTATIGMPNVEPLEDDMYICTGVSLPDDPAYIVGIHPDVTSDAVNRIWLIGCPKSQAKPDTAWSCNPDEPSSVCDGPALVTYKWSRDSCPNYLAKGEILTVGGNYIENLVLMVHYVTGGDIDDSGVTLKMMPDTFPRDDVMVMMKYYGATLISDSCEDSDDTYEFDLESSMYEGYDYPSKELEEIAEEEEDMAEEEQYPNDVIDASSDDGDLDDLIVVPDWPKYNLSLGQIGGIGTDKRGNLLVFHRAERQWTADSFDEDNVFQEGDLGPINNDVVFELESNSGKLVQSWGADQFYMPHGLTVDHEGNIWLTDVAMHQVFKFPPEGGDEPLLALGDRMQPGNDDGHFCKPTDVAVESKTGNFFVADGYCNSRIMKFNPEGELIMKWGEPSAEKNHAAVGTFDIPHSLALVEKYQMICVADRENGRIQCFDSNTAEFQFQITLPEFGGKMYAIEYNPQQDVIYAVNGENFEDQIVQGFTIDYKQKEVIGTWKPSSQGFDTPHDVTYSPQSLYSPQSVYVGEIGPNTVWKFREDVMERKIRAM